MAAEERQLNDLGFFLDGQIAWLGPPGWGNDDQQCSKFIDSYLAVLRQAGSKPIYEVFYLRLLR